MYFSDEQSTIIDEAALTTRAIERHEKMNILEMTDKKLYELGQKVLADKLGTDQVERFIQQCKPRDYDYTAERHKWLTDDPDILTMAKQIQEEKALQVKKESVKAARIAAWRNGLLELTDIEIYELGFKVLADCLGAYGLLRFITQHFKNLNAEQLIDQAQQFQSESVGSSVMQTMKEEKIPQD